MRSGVRAARPTSRTTGGRGAGTGWTGTVRRGLPYYKVGCRYYDPDAGRFISRDTDLSQSPYAYCGGDPVNFTDPSGHDDKKNPPLPVTQAPGASSSGSDGTSVTLNLGITNPGGSLQDIQDVFKVTAGNFFFSTTTSYSFSTGATTLVGSFGYNFGSGTVSFSPMPGGGMLTISSATGSSKH